MKRLAVVLAFVLVIPFGHHHHRPHGTYIGPECLDLGFHEDGTPIIDCKGEA